MLRSNVALLLVIAACGGSEPPPIDAGVIACEGGDGVATAVPTVVRTVSPGNRDSEPRVAPWGTSAIVAWQSTYFIGVGFASSADGGTWSPLDHLNGPEGETGDVSLATAANGTTFFIGIEVLDSSVDPPSLAPLVKTQIALGATQFDPPVEIASALHADKPSIAFDESGRLVIFYDDVLGAMTFIRAEDPAATTFAAPVPLHYSDMSLFGGARPAICVDRNRVAVAPVRAATALGLSLVRETAPGSWDIVGVPTADLPAYHDPGCVVDGNDLWIAYASFDTPGGAPRVGRPETFMTQDAADSIRVIHSPDGGLTFDRDVRVTGPISATKYMFPEFVRTGSGQLELVYYEGVPDGAAALSRATSVNGDCNSWSRQQLASVGTFQLTRLSGSWLGDYFGVLALGHSIIAAFTDNSGMFSGISTVRYDTP